MPKNDLLVTTNNLMAQKYIHIKKNKTILIASCCKKWLRKEFDMDWRKCGFRVMLTRVSHYLRTRSQLEWLTRLRNQSLGPKLVGTQTIIFLLFRLPLYRLGSEPEARDNNVPVSQYRTPFEYADITPLMNDKCTGWTRASPLVQLVFIGLYGEIRETRDYIFLHRSTFPECPGFPNTR